MRASRRPAPSAGARPAPAATAARTTRPVPAARVPGIARCRPSFVLCVDPFGHVGDQRRVDVPGLLVLRKTRLAFNRDAEGVERGIQLEFHLRVVVATGLRALPCGVPPTNRNSVV